MQFNLFDVESQEKRPIDLKLPDANVLYYPQWCSIEQASAYMNELTSSLTWQQDSIVMFGKQVKIPRLQAWYGEKESHYSYSGLSLSPRPWTPLLKTLNTRCSEMAGVPFNSVLANWYRDGNDSMSLHADDEPELGVNPIIASLTFGEARPFVFKHKANGTRYTHRLEHGSLLIMREGTQQHYLHGIAKTTKAIGDRINLTFRYLKAR